MNEVMQRFDSQYMSITSYFSKQLLAYSDAFTHEEHLTAAQWKTRQLEEILRAMNGSKVKFVTALEETMISDMAFEAIKTEVASVQGSAGTQPYYYIAFYGNPTTVQLGEHFFKPIAHLTDIELHINIEALRKLFHTLTQFKIAYDEQNEQTEEELMMKEKQELEELTSYLQPAASYNENEEDAYEALAEATEAIDDEFELEDAFEVEEDEHTAALSEEAEEEAELAVDEPIFEEPSTIELLSNAVVLLYKQADVEKRAAIKQLRADLFELEVAIELEEDAYANVLQFNEQLLALQFETVEELQLQVQMAKYALALLQSAK